MEQIHILTRLKRQKQSLVLPLTPNQKLLGMGVLFAISFFGSFCFGRYPVSLSQLVRILASSVLPIEKTWTPAMAAVVFNIRLPRIMLSSMVGCCLSVAGASYQGVFRNPMASPDILGATSGAAFGAALAFLLGASTSVITISSFFFSIITVMIVYYIGKWAPGRSVMNLILAGIMVSSIFTAGTSFIKLVADPNNELPAITYWLMGSFSAAKQYEVITIAGPMLLGLLPLLALRWRINLLTMGDEACRSMGVNPEEVRMIVIIASTVITAASVSVSGMIGWVGLVMPHLCRKIMGNNYTYLMPASMIFGAVFMLLVDNISRNLMATEIPIGILTAFIGAPFFAVLIFRRDSENV
ncbi:iron ABC transporter permease [Fusibacter paucivorans]|uniref:Iron ABC transporter permease n=2 Tax=Fusibacter paucivorans TaxID=76009 RepID=A0ABS5PJA8_9FIRM|nr:iron ABC transporter permease [Fusibacter paucivorans]